MAEYLPSRCETLGSSSSASKVNKPGYSKEAGLAEAVWRRGQKKGEARNQGAEGTGVEGLAEYCKNTGIHIK